MALSTGPCWSSWIPRATSWPHVQECPTSDSQWLDESPQWRWQTCRTSTESWNEWCLCYRQWFPSLWSPVWWVWHWCNANRQEIIWFEVINFVLCGSRKYPYLPHGGSRNFLGVGGSKRDKFLKGRGVHKEFFFPEGLKCDRMNTYVFFQLIRGSQEKPKVLSVEIDVGFLVIYFLLLSRRQMTRTAPRHTSEHVRRRVKQFPANFKASITRLSHSFIVFCVVTSLETLAKSIRCHLF